jgi:Flp pilus assembly protein TadB
MAQASPMPMCPMAETCQGMMEKPLSGLVMIPGIVFIALGVLIVVWPSILPWLVAAAFILAGGAMLLMVNFMRRVGARLRRAGD